MLTTPSLPLSGAPLQHSLALLAAWGAIGLAGLLRPHSVRFVGRTLFPLSALCGLALVLVGLANVGQPAAQLVLPIGLPDLPFHLRYDALSGFFLIVLGAASAGISLFAGGYFRQGEGTAPGLLCLQYHIFLASMGLVLLADDAYAFMVAWESMAVSSYFLVTTQHRLPEIRRAGFLYLLIAHLGAVAILLSFGVMQGGRWQFTFDAMRAAQLTPAMGDRGLPAGAARLRRQGRPGAAARLAARGASGRALAGVGADERRHAQDRRLRPAARQLRPARRAAAGGGAWSRSASACSAPSTASSSRPCRPT